MFLCFCCRIQSAGSGILHSNGWSLLGAMRSEDYFIHHQWQLNSVSFLFSLHTPPTPPLSFHSIISFPTTSGIQSIGGTSTLSIFCAGAFR